MSCIWPPLVPSPRAVVYLSSSPSKRTFVESINLFSFVFIRVKNRVHHAVTSFILIFALCAMRYFQLYSVIGSLQHYWVPVVKALTMHDKSLITPLCVETRIVEKIVTNWSTERYNRRLNRCHSQWRLWRSMVSGYLSHSLNGLHPTVWHFFANEKIDFTARNDLLQSWRIHPSFRAVMELFPVVGGLAGINVIPHSLAMHPTSCQNLSRLPYKKWGVHFFGQWYHHKYI